MGANALGAEIRVKLPSDLAVLTVGDEVLAGHLAQVDALIGREAVILRRQQRKALLADERTADAGVVHLRGKDQIDLARQQLLPQLVVRGLLIGVQSDVHAVRLGNIAHDDVRHKLCQRRKAGQRHDPLVRVDGVFELGDAAVQRFQRLRHMGQKHPPVGGQRHVASAAHKELDIQLLLQALHGVAEAGLVDVQRLRRLGVVFQFRYGFKVIELL